MEKCNWDFRANEWNPRSSCYSRPPVLPTMQDPAAAGCFVLINPLPCFQNCERYRNVHQTDTSLLCWVPYQASQTQKNRRQSKRHTSTSSGCCSCVLCSNPSDLPPHEVFSVMLHGRLGTHSRSLCHMCVNRCHSILFYPSCCRACWFSCHQIEAEPC